MDDFLVFGCESKEYLSYKFSLMFKGGKPKEIFGASDKDCGEYRVAIFSPHYSGIKKKEFEEKIESLCEKEKVLLVFCDNLIACVFRNRTDIFAKNFLKRIAAKVSKNPFAALGKKGAGLSGCLDSFCSAQSELPKIFYADECEILCAKNSGKSDSQKKISSPKKKKSFLKENILKIVFCIETYNRSQVDAIFSEYQNFCRLRLAPSNEVKAELLAYAIELQNELFKKYPERDFPKKSAFDLVSEIMGKVNFRACVESAKKITDDFLEAFNSSSPNSVVAKIVQYAKINYSANLRLEGMAKMFCCNAAYLGKKFREETGLQFNAYIDKIRVEEAKRLLKGTNFRVYQISKMVGYSNTDYFYLKFKRCAKMTPKQYRSEIRKKGGNAKNQKKTK